jgi:2-polyprenyl-3-methyl-5-hydroxy-6-metoxy-1,4-benzoquinol methylase
MTLHKTDLCVACNNELEMIYENPFLDIPNFNQQIYKCPNCGLGVSLPKLTQEQLYNLYDENYSQNPLYKTEDSDKLPMRERVNKKLISFFSLLYFNAKPKSLVRKIILNSKIPIFPTKCFPITITKKDYILDYGAGDWQFAKTLHHLGYNARGYDINPKSVIIGKSIGLYDNVLESSVPKKYNVIRMYQVIEHVENPVNFLMHINSLLESKGELVLNTPNFESPLLHVGKNGGYFHLPYHRFLFSRKSLYLLFEKAGFMIVRINTRSSGAGYVSYCLNHLENFNLISQVRFKIKSLYYDSKCKGDAFEVWALKIRDI